MTRRKIMFCLLSAMLILSACTKDLSDLYTRADELKEANSKEQQRIDEEGKKQEDEKKENDALKEKLDSIENAKSNGSGQTDDPDTPGTSVRLPRMEITTKNMKDITSKDSYLSAYMKLTEITAEGKSVNTAEGDLQIKGRGNTTWGFPKKPYRLKFTEKTSLLGEHQDKSWILLANYADKTMLRNQLAFIMGRMSNLDWTPSGHFVELTLNGKYIGVYQLCEKLKISNHRVAVGDDGFLLEIDQRAPESGSAYFTTSHIERPIKFREPDVAEGDANFNYARDFITKAEEALFSENYTNPLEGWQKYIDMDSFVDWYLINELAKNNDAVFFSSCYMNFKRGGKLKMGPIWDFDTAFGNINYNNNYETSGFHIRKVAWYSRLFSDPAFTAKVKERFKFFYDHRNDLMREIGSEAIAIESAIERNEEVWHILYNYTWPNYEIWGSYNNEVQYMKTWLNKRFEWMRGEIGL